MHSSHVRRSSASMGAISVVIKWSDSHVRVICSMTATIRDRYMIISYVSGLRSARCTMHVTIMTDLAGEQSTACMTAFAGEQSTAFMTAMTAFAGEQETACIAAMTAL